MGDALITTIYKRHVMAFTKNPLTDGTKKELAVYSNDLENRIEDATNIEDGNNFVKLPNGTQIVFGYRSGAVDSSGKLTVTFPKTFVGVPIVSISSVYMTSARTSVIFANQTNQKFDAYFTVNNANATGVQHLSYIAIGFWK